MAVVGVGADSASVFGFSVKGGDRKILPRKAPHVPTKVTLPEVGMVSATDISVFNPYKVLRE